MSTLTAARRLAAVVLLAGLWLLASGTAAQAHAVLRSSDPADGASVDRAPRQVTLTFTERPEPRLSTVQVLDADGRPVQAGKAGPVPGQPFQLQVPLGALPDGTYTVAWRTVSRDDGHVTGGSFAFGVGIAAPAAGTKGAGGAEASTPPPTPLATAGRWLLYCGLALLVGAAATGLAVYQRRLPPGARPLLLVGVGLAAVGLAARVAAERAAVGASLADLVASDTGRNLARLAAGVLASAIAAGWLAARSGHPASPADPARPSGELGERPSGRVGRGWLAAVGLTAAVAMGLQVLAGHAAAPSGLRPVNLLAQWLHLLAAGVWAGGLVWLLAGLLGRPRRGPSEAATAGVADRAQIVIRFSRLALPVVGVLAATGLNRALDLAGGWSGLTRAGFGRVLDLKLLLFAGLLVLAARNRYRLLPALAGPAGRLDALRRSVTAEVGLVAAVLLAAALLTQLPPGKFALATATARPSPPANVQVQGSDVTTSVRLALTATPGTAGPNHFVARVTDYDSGQVFPAQRVALRFSLPDRPEIGGATLELTRATGGDWQGTGSQLSIDGRWSITALVQGSGAAVTVPLELRTRTVEPKVTVSRAPGQPDLYTIGAPNGGSVQAYVDPGRPGPNTVHFTFFTRSGSEQAIDGANATMTSSLGRRQSIDLQLLTAGHFAANLDLPTGQVGFTINATPAQGPPITASFSQQIK